MPSLRVAIETILLHIMRTHQSLPIEVLVRRLAELEEAVEKPGPVENKIKPLSHTQPQFLKTPPVEAPPFIKKTQTEETTKPSFVYDTLMQFAAVELNGKLQRVHNNEN